MFVFVWQANVSKNELDCRNGKVETVQTYPQNLNLAGLHRVYCHHSNTWKCIQLLHMSQYTPCIGCTKKWTVLGS